MNNENLRIITALYNWEYLTIEERKRAKQLLHGMTKSLELNFY